MIDYISVFYFAESRFVTWAASQLRLTKNCLKGPKPEENEFKTPERASIQFGFMEKKNHITCNHHNFTPTHGEIESPPR